MAIEGTLGSKIQSLTERHWSEHVQDEGFAELIEGKEPGHRMADYVDDRTSALLKVNLDTRYEGNANGSIKKRSMGDIWVHSQDIFNPLNIKSGLQHMNGQPNVVSMQKLLDYIFHRWIDSYYLLIIKFDISGPITHKTYLIDLLDWTDFITYDAGPGQIMLRERDFYHAADSGHVPRGRPIEDKVASLFELLEQQIEALFANRIKRRDRQRSRLEEFSGTAFIVDQSQMKFVL